VDTEVSTERAVAGVDTALSSWWAQDLSVFVRLLLLR